MKKRKMAIFSARLMVIARSVGSPTNEVTSAFARQDKETMESRANSPFLDFLKFSAAADKLAKTLGLLFFGLPVNIQLAASDARATGR